MTLRRISLALLLLVCATPLAAQDPLGWNSGRAHGLIERARERRELPRGDSTLQNYQAKAKGFVYFYLDRREDDERTLVKVDQIALDLYWKRPNLTKQIIVGLRDVSRLPNRMYYHLDHLTVVQNNLGDVIRIGDGDEVRDVPHPAAPGADTIYDYRLADSVTLQLGGGQPDVRVYEVQVRPKRTDRPAFLGSVFVDRDAADIVRMTFTFTPSSYVDRRLDYIHISLDNGLFGGKYWLPNEQSVEIRRQLPELDFAAGAVIKGRLSVASYVFNEPIPDSVFYGRPVTAVTPGEREAFPFPDDIYSGVNEEGLAPPPQMEDLRARAAELIGDRRLSGLPAWRFYIPNASSVLRHSQAEGWYGGVGVTYSPSPTFRADFTGGYAFGAEKPELGIGLQFRPRDLVLLARGYHNEPRDFGPARGMPGVVNTFTSAFFEDDYTDTYFARGVALSGTARLDAGLQFGAQLSAERHTHSERERSDGTLRPFKADNGDALTGTLSLMLTASETERLRLSGGVEASITRFDFDDFNEPRELPGLSAPTNTSARLVLRAKLGHESADRSRDAGASVFAGTSLTQDVPVQYHFFVGGRETLPGHDYRSIVGKSLVLTNLVVSRSVFAPWVRVRFLGNMAQTREHRRVSEGREYDWNSRASAGVGVGLLWDVLRIDVVKGAHWQTLFSVRHDFWDLL